MVYEPQEDSAMLARHVSRLTYGRVLDMCTGSGILAWTACQSNKVTSVLGVDIDKRAIAFAKKTYGHKKATFKTSDLFKNVSGTFDTIIINPPYLPAEEGLKDVALVGGKRGYEFICKFLNQAPKFLKANSQILMVYSSLTKPAKIKECLDRELFVMKELETFHQFFEDIMVVRFTKSSVRIRLEKDGFQNLSYFARGKRGWIFTAWYKRKKVAIKIKNPSSMAVSSIQHEATMLSRLNKHEVGPKLVKVADQYVAYEFVEGVFIVDFLENASRKRIMDVLKGVLDQCRVMDTLGISKEEMTRPVKHIIITREDMPILIDFERAHHTHKPHNVTQFCQFLNTYHNRFILASKNIHIAPDILQDSAKAYSKKPNRPAYSRILALLHHTTKALR